ncbi:hypothetical protein AQUCO_02300033v1 [Aquilegia coerulea]|uniref:Mitochondrial transcription termination factor family protein n=1 Tax=Aquilegia coerulea TaxID=218851 RepID=A0A2G5DBR9_AQUCA|nr:hypothetical protein AQUCO_02300033v1 [Aquilegia coerulea]
MLGMGKSFTSSSNSPLVLTSHSATSCYNNNYSLDIATSAANIAIVKQKVSHGRRTSGQFDEIRGRACLPISTLKKWNLGSGAQTESITLGDEEKKMWDMCREALTAFEFSIEEKDKILGKAFGHVHSPYWWEERVKEAPKLEVVSEILDYLRSLGLSDDDIGKLLKKFPEVLGCSLNDELKNNVQVLEKTWGIKGKSLRSLLLRNPKVLGYNVDCKGDCEAKCTRCWVRF